MIPEDQRDHHLSEKLWEEREGILAWAFAGLQQYREVGVRLPFTDISGARSIIERY